MAIKILIADDHQLVREGLATLLSDDPNIEVVGQAQDGKEAIENAKKLKPDILIMDIGMPLVNGIEATGILKKKIPELKVIGLTLHAEKNFVRGMLEAGAYGYLFKTCAYEELILAINTVNSGNKYFSNEITDILVNEYIGKQNGVEMVDPLLTERELEILKLIAEGKSSNEIAEELFVSAKTVGTHKQHIYEKLNISSNVELVKYAIKKGIISIW